MKKIKRIIFLLTIVQDWPIAHSHDLTLTYMSIVAVDAYEIIIEYNFELE